MRDRRDARLVLVKGLARRLGKTVPNVTRRSVEAAQTVLIRHPRSSAQGHSVALCCSGCRQLGRQRCFATLVEGEGPPFATRLYRPDRHIELRVLLFRDVVQGCRPGISSEVRPAHVTVSCSTSALAPPPQRAQRCPAFHFRVSISGTPSSPPLSTHGSGTQGTLRLQCVRVVVHSGSSSFSTAR